MRARTVYAIFAGCLSAASAALGQTPPPMPQDLVRDTVAQPISPKGDFLYNWQFPKNHEQGAVSMSAFSAVDPVTRRPLFPFLSDRGRAMSLEQRTLPQSFGSGFPPR